ncbi:MAG: hypothetical protein ABI277_03735 [Burkholderiaceae bacterium]
MFIGRFAASAGFVIYSRLLDNIVFVVSNIFLLRIATVGRVRYLRNRDRERRTMPGTPTTMRTTGYGCIRGDRPGYIARVSPTSAGIAILAAAAATDASVAPKPAVAR